MGATRRIGTRRRTQNRNHDKEEMQNVWSKIADPAAACLIAWLAACLAYCLSYSILPGEAFAFWGRVVRRAAERGGWRMYLVKPLGGCDFCTAWWVGCGCAVAAGLDWWCVPLTGAASAVAVVKINEWLTSI